MTPFPFFLNPSSRAGQTPIDILLIEDHEPIRTVLIAALTHKGYSVCSATNGRKAMPFLNQHVFRLLITDIYMPEMDGFEVIQHHQATTPHVPVLTMTGGCVHTPPEQNLKMARILGSRGAIVKPFELDDFLGVVHGLLNTSTSEDAVGQQPRRDEDVTE